MLLSSSLASLQRSPFGEQFEPPVRYWTIVTVCSFIISMVLSWTNPHLQSRHSFWITQAKQSHLCTHPTPRFSHLRFCNCRISFIIFTVRKMINAVFPYVNSAISFTLYAEKGAILFGFAFISIGIISRKYINSVFSFNQWYIKHNHCQNHQAKTLYLYFGFKCFTCCRKFFCR